VYKSQVSKMTRGIRLRTTSLKDTIIALDVHFPYFAYVRQSDWFPCILLARWRLSGGLYGASGSFCEWQPGDQRAGPRILQTGLLT